MQIHINFADQATFSREAYAQSVRRSMSILWLLISLLFILLAALLAVWVAVPEGRAVAGWNGLVASEHLKAGETPAPVADLTEAVAAGTQIDNQFPNPESWYEDTSPYAHEPLVISSSGGGMNLPK